MAKKLALVSATRALVAALPADVKTIQIPQSATVVVDVDVNDMNIPYTVAVDGETFIKALVDRRKTLSLEQGVHRLNWSFMHGLKGWMHNLVIKVNNTSTTLDKKSEANKDQDTSAGVVFLVVA